MDIHAIDVLVPAPDDGKPGNDAVNYVIVCSNSSPNVSDGDVTVSLTAYKIEGSKREMCTFDGHLCFGNATEGQYINDNPATIVMPKGSTKAVIIELIDEDVLAVCTISPVVNGVNGTSVLAQYCPSSEIISIGGTSTKPDESNIHDSYKDGDEWMRTKSSTDAAYGSWFRIVGEKGTDGEYTDYTFNLSRDKTTKDAYTVPGNLKSKTWTDAPQVPNTNYPYLWMRMERKNLPAGTAILYGHEYTYVRLTGEDGKTVTAQYSIDGKTNWHSPFATGDIWMRTSEDGGKTWGAAVRIVGEKGDSGAWTDYRFNISSALTTSSPLTAPTPLGRSSWADAPMATTDAFPYLWMMVQKYSDTTTKDGQPTYMRLTGEQGKPGQTGGVGPMMYYAREWQSGVSYVRTAQVVPLVSHGSDQFFYYPAKDGALLNNEPSSSNTAWKQQQKVPLLLAQLLMVDFGKIASAVFCGDYMLSQYGKKKDGTVVDGNSSDKDKAYKDFDVSNPNGGTFIPNLWLNFLTGKMKSTGGEFEDISATGFLYSKPFTVVDDNFAKWIQEDKIGEGYMPKTLLRKGFIDYRATGTRYIFLVGIGRQTLSDEEKQTIRSMIGNVVRIYNNGSGTLMTTGDTVPEDWSEWTINAKIGYLKRTHDISYGSTTVEPGHFLILRCVADIDANGNEVVYWKFTLGKI